MNASKMLCTAACLVGRVSLFPLPLLVLSFACQQPERVTTAPQASSALHTTQLAVTGSKFRRPSEDLFVEIARQEPEFGGYYLDRHHNLIVYVRDSSRFANARAALAQHLAANGLGLPLDYRVASIVVRKADYTFQQLSDWRDLVSERILGVVNGVFSSDLDEAINRVTIGVDASTGSNTEDAIANILTPLGVPLQALHFAEGRPPVPPALSTMRTASYGASAFTTDTSLKAGGDTLVAGLEIRRSLTFPNYELCTIGAIIDWKGTRYAVTASHCSTTMYGLDAGDSWHQVDNALYVGNEAWDTTSNSTYGLLPARNSDAALIAIDTMPSMRGVIARTTSRSNGSGGSRTVNTSTPFLYVSTTSGTPTTGLEVNKVGRTTGWTYGYVVGTCVDMVNSATNKAIRCTIKASVYDAQGDSGASLWSWDGVDGANLYGLTNCLVDNDGTTTVDGQIVVFGYNSYYSEYTGFAADLGGSTGLSATTGVTVGTFADSGTVSISNPVVSWAEPTVGGTGSSSNTRYYVYRSTSDGELNNPIATYYGGTYWLDLDQTVTSYYGHLVPPHGSWVSYRVKAYNWGVGQYSSFVVFTR